MDRIPIKMAVLLDGKRPFDTSMESPGNVEIWNVVAGVLIMGGVAPDEVSRLFAGSLRVYDRKRKRFLDTQKSMADEGVEKDAVLVLTDIDDERRIAAATTTLGT